MSEQSSQILAAIEKLDSSIEKLQHRVSEFRDEFKEEILRMSERVVVLEAFKQNYDQNFARFWNQTWPTQEKWVAAVEDRVRMLEREQVQIARITELEHKLDASQTELGKKLSEVSAKGEKTAWSVNLFQVGFTIITSAVVAAAVKFLFPH
jgi:uncharacterized protein Yka (UPF0111/DUF47 family)